MIIEKFKILANGDKFLGQTQLHCEENNIPPMNIYFYVLIGYLPSQHVINGAFLISAVLPALHLNERRVMLEGSVDPVIINGINTIIAQQSCWFDYKKIASSLKPALQPHCRKSLHTEQQAFSRVGLTPFGLCAETC